GKLNAAQSAIAGSSNACTPLNAFLTTVIDKTGKASPQLSVAQATTLLDGANAVVISLGCPASSVARAQAEDDTVALTGQINGMSLGSVGTTLLGKTTTAGDAIVAGTGCPQLAALQSQITAYVT